MAKKSDKIKREVHYSVMAEHWKDKKTGAYMIYSKKFDICGYGKTKNEARIMFEFQITDILLLTKPKKKK